MKFVAGFSLISFFFCVLKFYYYMYFSLHLKSLLIRGGLPLVREALKEA